MFFTSTIKTDEILLEEHYSIFNQSNKIRQHMIYAGIYSSNLWRLIASIFQWLLLIYLIIPNKNSTIVFALILVVGGIRSVAFLSQDYKQFQFKISENIINNIRYLSSYLSVQEIRRLRLVDSWRRFAGAVEWILCIYVIQYYIDLDITDLSFITLQNVMELILIACFCRAIGYSIKHHQFD